MKKLNLILVLVLVFNSCIEVDKCTDVICDTGVCVDGICVGETDNKIVTQNITSDTTWTSDNIYELRGMISVENGVTLTIEAGTVIKGSMGSSTNASALIVAIGGRIVADGTKTSPIIFTSVSDEITPQQIQNGDFSSPNLTMDNNGLWGGLIILGGAPISTSVSPTQIEGIPSTNINGRYGGSDASDDSGILRYVSIRHGGTNIGSGNEINGLTLGGVGSGTIIENIEIVGNQDDGIEFFGGTVNVKNLIVANVGDDAIDIDQSWGGTLDNFAVVCGTSTDHALEVDGPEGMYVDESSNVINGTIKGSGVSEIGDFRDDARGNFSNIYFYNFPNPNTGKGDFTLSSGSELTYQQNKLTFSNLEITTIHQLDSIFKNGTHIHTNNVNTNTIGVDTTVFSDWTWVMQNLML
jgi:hypothetical protein